MRDQFPITYCSKLSCWWTSRYAPVELKEGADPALHYSNILWKHILLHSLQKQECHSCFWSTFLSYAASFLAHYTENKQKNPQTQNKTKNLRENPYMMKLE